MFKQRWLNDKNSKNDEAGKMYPTDLNRKILAIQLDKWLQPYTSLFLCSLLEWTTSLLSSVL